MRGLAGVVALFAAGGAKPAGANRRPSLGPGDACTDDSECLGADAPLVCAWNGFGYDGDYNCCTYEGSRCGFDAACCGLSVCNNGRCASVPDIRGPGDPCQPGSTCIGADAPLTCDYVNTTGDFRCCTYEGSRCGFDAACCGAATCVNGICASGLSYASPGDPCQTTDQCRRPQTGAICEYTVSTGDSRCCWYEGSFCTSGAQCCGARVCTGGVCGFPTGGSGAGSGTACTWDGCPCVLYRDPECRASCPLYDPCDPGLVCTGTSEDIGACVPA
jgi:hypothetical protein